MHVGWIGDEEVERQSLVVCRWSSVEPGVSRAFLFGIECCGYEGESELFGADVSCDGRGAVHRVL